ncbi:MAG TPA: heparinase II/III family protein [Chthoniobacteraceae bacterium]|nr:heparinase II/III family protein [Chthoniobacteraceae bacterium]
MSYPTASVSPLVKESFVRACSRFKNPPKAKLWELALWRTRAFVEGVSPELISDDSNRRAWGPLFASAMLLSHAPESREASLMVARRALHCILDAPVWGKDPFGVTDNLDLVAAHCCQGLALGLSWADADALSPELRQEAELRLFRQAALFYEAAQQESVFWCRSYLQNHHWIDWSGLYASACYFEKAGRAAEVAPWLDLCERELRIVQTHLPEDGSSYEGVMYLHYGINSLMLWMELHGERTGENLYDASRFWKALGGWLLAHYSGNGLAYITYGDGGYGAEGEAIRHDACGLFAALAWRMGDRRAQFGALLTARANASVPEKTPYAEAHKQPNLLLFIDPEIKPEPGLPTGASKFEDSGEWLYRTEVEGTEVLFGTKWGPPGGKACFARFTEFSGMRRGPLLPKGEVLNPDHVHADMGHFVLLAGGRPFIADMGYGIGKAINFGRESIQSTAHNVLLFNGRGQWVPSHRDYRGKEMPNCLEVGQNAVSLDLACAYPESWRPEKYHRAFSWPEPGRLVITDTIRLREATPLIFQLHGQVETVPLDGRGVAFRHGGICIEVTPPNLPSVLELIPETRGLTRASWIFNETRRDITLRYELTIRTANR